MKKLPLLLFLCLFIACKSDSPSDYTSTGQKVYKPPASKQKYNIETARLLARLYYLSNPLVVAQHPSQVTNLVRANAHLLGENSKAIQCSRDLGALLINQGIHSFGDRNESRERMYDIGHANDVDPLITKRAADDMYNGAADLYAMGAELAWLSQVIPAAAQGNWDPFNTTGTDMRKLFYQFWPMIQPMMNSGFSDLSSQPMIDQLLSQLQPAVEEQIMILVLMIQN